MIVLFRAAVFNDGIVKGNVDLQIGIIAGELRQRACHADQCLTEEDLILLQILIQLRLFGYNLRCRFHSGGIKTVTVIAKAALFRKQI